MTALRSNAQARGTTTIGERENYAINKRERAHCPGLDGRWHADVLSTSFRMPERATAVLP